MNKLLVELPESLPGKFVLLHSGYGGGQYVGKVVGVKPSEKDLPILIFQPGTWRYQPKGSTAGPDYVFYWHFLDDDWRELPLKEKDRLYLVGDRTDLSFFENSRNPINPENQRHAWKLAGKESLELLYGGSELLMVR